MVVVDGELNVIKMIKVVDEGYLFVILKCEVVVNTTLAAFSFQRLNEFLLFDQKTVNRKPIVIYFSSF